MIQNQPSFNQHNLYNVFTAKPMHGQFFFWLQEENAWTFQKPKLVSIQINNAKL